MNYYCGKDNTLLNEDAPQAQIRSIHDFQYREADLPSFNLNSIYLYTK